VRKSEQQRFGKILDGMKTDLLDNAKRAIAGDIHLDPDDFPDEIDSASSESELAFIGRLREREKHLIQKIDKALRNIEEGTYGKCLSCEEDIGAARLKARPVADLCIDCKSQQERLER
jgi:DnaK suppressor protein